jgi:SAM-dependent methyltransferase
MSFIEKLKKINHKEQFNPGVVGIFISAGYFIKKGIYDGVKRNAAMLSGRMLDFGCGNKPYQDLFYVREYIGMDIENIAHDHSNENVDVFYDGKHIPFDDSSFDSVFATEVFEHVFNLDEILSEINRVMKKDGRLLITLPFVWYQHEKPNDFARYTEFGISHLLRKHNFEIMIHEKSSSFFETSVQTMISYIYEAVFPKNKVLKILLAVIFIAPLNIFGIIGRKIFPKNHDFFLNHIIVAKKTA